MDSESCELGSCGKRNWSDSYCCSLPPAKRFNKNAIFSSEEIDEDDFSCISDLIQATGDCEFSDGNLRFYDESTPNSTQSDLDDLLTSLLTESEIPNSFSVPETINGVDEDARKMGSSTSLYSGPTLTDIQSALSMYHKKEQYLPASSLFDSPTILDSLQSAKPPPSQTWLDSLSYGSYRNFSSSINDIFYGRLRRAKSEAKYSVKVKCPGNSIGDGYKWRKYGQKSIKNSPYPRSYYRCTNPKCRAKKQVERCVEDPETITITYEGLHLHFSDPPLQIAQLQPNYSLSHQDNNIYKKGRIKKASLLDNGCLNNEGGDIMQSSESHTIVAAHQEAKDNCCESLQARRSVPVVIITDLLDGYNGGFKNDGNDLLQSSESRGIVAVRQEEKDKLCESLRSRESMLTPIIANFVQPQISNGTSEEENSDIIDGSCMNFRVDEEKGGGWGKDGLLQDIVPFQVINPQYSLSSPASSSSSSPQSRY